MSGRIGISNESFEKYLYNEDISVLKKNKIDRKKEWLSMES